MKAYYYGTFQSPGHLLIEEGMKRVNSRVNTGLPFQARALDGFLPGNAPQNKIHLMHLDGYTLLLMGDYTVDKRPGSVAVFILPLRLGQQDALIAANKAFPTIFARLAQAGPFSWSY